MSSSNPSDRSRSPSESSLPDDMHDATVLEAGNKMSASFTDRSSPFSSSIPAFTVRRPVAHLSGTHLSWLLHPCMITFPQYLPHQLYLSQLSMHLDHTVHFPWHLVLFHIRITCTLDVHLLALCTNPVEQLTQSTRTLYSIHNNRRVQT